MLLLLAFQARGHGRFIRGRAAANRPTSAHQLAPQQMARLPRIHFVNYVAATVDGSARATLNSGIAAHLQFAQVHLELLLVFQ